MAQLTVAVLLAVSFWEDGSLIGESARRGTTHAAKHASKPWRCRGDPFVGADAALVVGATWCFLGRGDAVLRV